MWVNKRRLLKDIVYFFQIQDLVGYLKPYHVYPNVPPAGLETLEDAFERYSTLQMTWVKNLSNSWGKKQNLLF